MTTPVLICDDSSFARKQMTRCLPGNWDIDITYASNGAEGLEAIAAGKGDLVFLDLNMPQMDGFDVLKEIQSNDLNALAIVVSGDVQEETLNRVRKLGALDFIEKPVKMEQVLHILSEYGIYRPDHIGASRETGAEFDVQEAYQELANVALGRAVKLLARYLDVGVEMSLPRVSHPSIEELQTKLEHMEGEHRVSAVCQGFIGGGISGEAILMFADSSLQDIARLMQVEVSEENKRELLLDTANLMIGACLSGIAAQTDVRFSSGHPHILDRQVALAKLLGANGAEPALTIEMGCRIEIHGIDIELLMLFTESSIDPLNTRLNNLVR